MYFPNGKSKMLMKNKIIGFKSDANYLTLGKNHGGLNDPLMKIDYEWLLSICVHFPSINIYKNFNRNFPFRKENKRFVDYIQIFRSISVEKVGVLMEKL